MAKSSSKKAAAKAVKATNHSKVKTPPVKQTILAKPAIPVKPVVAAKPAAKPVPAKFAGKINSSKPVEPVAKKRLVVEPEPEVVIPQVAAVPTDGKPRKNMAGLTSRELEVYRDAILAKRREIVGDMSSMEREALRSSGGTNLSSLPIHMADMGTDNYEQEFTLGLMEKDHKLLRDLNDALAKIQNGTYGICEGTGKPISKARLEAQPWARYSIEYARKLERGIR